MVINIFRLSDTTKTSTPHAEVELSRTSRVNKRYDDSIGIPLSHIFYYSYRILLEQTPLLIVSVEFSECQVVLKTRLQ